MTDSATCYRHPGRESWVLCQRCGNTICPDCQRQAAVGFHCPDCVKGSAPKAARVISGPRLQLRLRGNTSSTTVLLAIMAAMFVLDFVTSGLVNYIIGFDARLVLVEPWTMVTSIFAHSGIMHLLFNGYSLWVLGSMLERVMGPGRFTALFLLSGVAGSAAVLVLDPTGGVIGASGAIFGLFAALFVVNRGFGGSNVSLLVIVGINLVLGFIIPGVSWQAHIGGLIGGLVLTPLLMGRRR